MRLTAITNGQVVVEVVVLSQDAQGQPQRILARAQTETDPGKKVSLGIGEGSVSLTPEIKPRAKLRESANAREIAGQAYRTRRLQATAR